MHVRMEYPFDDDTRLVRIMLIGLFSVGHIAIAKSNGYVLLCNRAPARRAHLHKRITHNEVINICINGRTNR